MDDIWYERLMWMGPLGLIALTFVLSRLRKWIVSLRKKPDLSWPAPPPADPAATSNPADYADLDQEARAHGHTGEPQADPMYVVEAKPPEPENPIEAYYKEHKRTLGDVERQIALVNQKAQFECVEKGIPQLVTIYDPHDVASDQPIARTEEFPLDDMRRQDDSGHPAAGMLTEDIVVIDYRPLPNEMCPGFAPRPFRERYLEKARVRREAIKDGAIKTARPDGTGRVVEIKSSNPRVQADIEKHQEYSGRVRDQAQRDFEELKPQIKADAEKIAREKFVPPRMEDFKKEAEERGVPVDTVVEEFVRKVGEDAVWAAEARFKKAGPLDESNPLLKALTPDRMRKAGAWQY